MRLRTQYRPAEKEPRGIALEASLAKCQGNVMGTAAPVTEQPGRARRGGPACPPRRGQPHRVAPTKKMQGPTRCHPIASGDIGAASKVRASEATIFFFDCLIVWRGWR